jgi:hypothetical protein
VDHVIEKAVAVAHEQNVHRGLPPEPGDLSLSILANCRRREKSEEGRSGELRSAKQKDGEKHEM